MCGYRNKSSSYFPPIPNHFPFTAHVDNCWRTTQNYLFTFINNRFLYLFRDLTWQQRVPLSLVVKKKRLVELHFNSKILNYRAEKKDSLRSISWKVCVLTSPLASRSLLPHLFLILSRVLQSFWNDAHLFTLSHLCHSSLICSLCCLSLSSALQPIPPTLFSLPRWL